jgi:hypothetical protein
VSPPIDTDELRGRLRALAVVAAPPADGFDRIRTRARRRQTRRVLAAATATVAVIAAAALAAANLSGGGLSSSRPAGAPIAPPTRTASPAPSSTTNSLYTVMRRLVLPDAPYELLALNRSALYVAGPSMGLLRVDRSGLAITASTNVPNLTAAAVGAGGLWVATGEKHVVGGCNCTPPPASRLLLRLDPTSLAVTARFTMPVPPLLVTVAAGQLWVAAPGALLHVDPANGRVLATETLGFYPVAMAASPDGQRLYVLGNGQASESALLADYDPATGRRLAKVDVGHVSGGPLAPTATGVWLPDQEPSANGGRTVIRLYSGPQLGFAGSATAGTFVTAPYVAGDTLWLVDHFGRGSTICADPTTGRIRITGPPLGIPGAVAADPAGTYMLQNDGFGPAAEHDNLLQVHPSRQCQ